MTLEHHEVKEVNAALKHAKARHARHRLYGIKWKTSLKMGVASYTEASQRGQRPRQAETPYALAIRLAEIILSINDKFK